MSETELKKLVETFLEEFWKMKPLEDVAIRNPPSKHQRKLRQLIDMVRVFEANYNLKFSDPQNLIRKYEGA
ncbi:MAG TPA: hypothetical protein VMW50_03005 [Dehalococcoidia bacterium]|nr:hypothetical protein [Dehalococcoidia bacterium]